MKGARLPFSPGLRHGQKRVIALILRTLRGERATTWTRGTSAYRERAMKTRTRQRIGAHKFVYLPTDRSLYIKRLLRRRLHYRGPVRASK